MNTIEIIRTAADNITEENWGKGHLFNGDKSCAIGHLLRVVGVTQEYSPGPGALQTYDNEEIQDALNEVAFDVRRRYPQAANWGSLSIDTVWRFNDKYAMDHTSVKKQLMETVERLQSELVGV